MTYVGHRDVFFIVSALTFITTHGIELMVNHNIDYQGFMIHQAIMPHKLLSLREYWVSVEIFGGFDQWVRP